MQWSTVPNNKKKIRIWYPSLITRNSSRARQPLSRVNVTELLLRLLVKIGNIYLFKIIIKIKNMETSLKTGFAQIFSCCPKNLSCPNFGGAAATLAPPARTPMSMSIKEHLLHLDSPDIDFSLKLNLRKNSKKCSSLNPKTCSNPVIIDQFSFLLHCQY